MNEDAPAALHFLDFVFDADDARLWRGGDVINLRPKTLAVLAYLSQRPGQLVTKEELLAAVWADTTVTEWVLTSCVKELRQALGDDSRQPHIIATVHGRGYRFIAVPLPAHRDGNSTTTSTRGMSERPASPTFVGRQAELAELHTWLDEALQQRRQVGFLVGEPGIGKTTLLDLFVASLPERDPNVRVARGQCVEQHGIDEPYLPLLDAITRLCVGSDTPGTVELLRRHAPTWLVQLIGVIEPAEASALEQRLGSINRTRMWRELSAFLEALPHPLVLVLEDLHWSDPATLHVLASLAQRRDPLRLLVLGTYRPVDVSLRQHPLKAMHHELLTQGTCRDLWLKPLDTRSVAAFLRSRWPELDGVDTLAGLVHDRTDGNPLFLLNVANALVADGIIQRHGESWVVPGNVTQVSIDVPHGLRQMIATRFERLSDVEREILAAGSIIGRSFSAALVAAALERDILDVEEHLTQLVDRNQVVHADGESSWPDATLAGAYRFLHSLYQTVIRDRLSPSRRRQLHGRIADRLESAYGERTSEIAAELAFHREAGGQIDRAIPHLEAAADRALRRGAGHQAVTLLEHGIALLDSLSTTPERTQKLAHLCIRLGRALPSVHGYTQPAVEAAYGRARELSQQTEDLVSLIQSLAGLTTVYVARGKFDRAAEAARGVSRLRAQLPLPIFEFADHFFSGLVRYHTGPLAAARRHFETAYAIDDIDLPAFSIHPRVATLGYLGATLLHQGHPDRGRDLLRDAIEHTRISGRMFDRAFVLQMECICAIMRRDLARIEQVAAEAMIVGNEIDAPPAAAIGRLGSGLCQVKRGAVASGLENMQAGIDTYRVGGHLAALPFLLCSLADGLATAGDLEAALLPLAETRALVTSTGEQRIEVELHRLEGDIRARRGDHAAAERCFLQALELAQQQGARWWELRATTSWASWVASQSKSAAQRRQAQAALAEMVDSFGEGEDTVDMHEARRVLTAG